MIVRLIGDIHLGKRFPYTTLTTAKRFDAYRAMLLRQISSEESVQHCIQLGDLFDEYSVRDEVLVQGYYTCKNFKQVIAGNHDLSKNSDKPSALNLLRDHLGINVVSGKRPVVQPCGKTNFHLVPHQLSQESFEACLLETLDSKESLNTFNVLLLHCNYGVAKTGVASDNYLTPTMADKLSGTFDYIVSGHEHNYRRPHPKVIMLGSILPMSFGEMETKYVLDFDTETCVCVLEPTWLDSQYLKVSVEQLLSEDCSTWNVKDFVEVVGEVDIGPAAKVNKKISELYKTDKALVAVKNSTVLHKHVKTAERSTTEHWLDSLLNQCNTESQKRALKELYKSVES